MHLHQNIAIASGVRAASDRSLTAAYHQIQKKGESSPLAGISRTYVPKDDAMEALPPESTKVQVKTEQVIAGLEPTLVQWLNVKFTGEVGNTLAKADVVVDGTTVVAGAPVGYLLFLERQLTDLLTFIGQLPVLDPAEDWTYDPNAGAYRSAEKVTFRSKKVPRTLVAYEATKDHPAQVSVWQEDVVVGDWHTTKFSGALPQASVDNLTARGRALLQAVAQAREAANAQVVQPETEVGQKIFDYLFAE